MQSNPPGQSYRTKDDIIELQKRVHLWSTPFLQELFFALEGLGFGHHSDLLVRDLCPVAPMEFAPVRPKQFFDFNDLSQCANQVFTAAGLPLLPSRSMSLKPPGE